jgi:hypothetical protein
VIAGFRKSDAALPVAAERNPMTREAKSRPRHVVFRISEQEHNYLTQVCEEMGFRSLSEFVRQAAFHYASTRRPGRTLLADDLATLTLRLEDLDTHLADLRKIVGQVLGSSTKQGSGDPQPDSAE